MTERLISNRPVPDSVMIVDIGTNTVNTALVRPGAPTLRHTYFTHLGEGLDERGTLSDEAIERAIGVLTQAAEAATAGGVDLIEATATSASRDAGNSAQFLDRAESVLGVRPRVIPGVDEAALTFEGALTAVLDSPADRLDASVEGPVLVVDIGGGSTELALGTLSDAGPELTTSVSLQMGSVRFTDRFMHGDPPLPEELSNCLSVAEATLDEALSTHPGFEDAATLVFVSGTAETVGAVELGGWDERTLHGLRLSKAQVEDVFRTLATESADDRRHNPGLPAERVDVIVAGCCILVTIMRRMAFGDCVVSIGSVADGLATRVLAGGPVPGKS